MVHSAWVYNVHSNAILLSFSVILYCFVSQLHFHVLYYIIHTTQCTSSFYITDPNLYHKQHLLFLRVPFLLTH